MRRQVIFLICSICMIAVSATAGEVKRGEALIDEGEVIRKSGITLIPFAAFEYGYNGYYLQDFDSDIEATSGVAFGLVLARSQDMIFSFYSRQPLESAQSETNLYGISISKSVGKSVNYINSYSAAAEYYNWTDEPDRYSDIEIDQYRLRIGWVGKDKLKKSDKLYRNLGAGFAVGYGNLEMSNVYSKDIDWQRINNRSRLTGEGNFMSWGFYLEGGIGYRVTDKLNIDCKLVLEGLTSQEGAEIEGTDVVPIATNAYIRAGLSYMF